ncbi:septum formation initiator family protein [Schumannella sp. 10F1B-5-1]|nr:septum formation initiator family protein [Schumannella sp. 10F1B-5-1]
MEGETRAAAWLRSFRLSGFALSVLLLIVAALVVLAPGLKTFVEQRTQIAALQKQVDDAQSEVDDLDAEVDRWSDPAYIEAQARGRLYYVIPGDVTYLVTGETAAPTTTDSQPISDAIQTTRIDWVSSLVSSLFTAGTTQAPAGQGGAVQLDDPTKNQQ